MAETAMERAVRIALAAARYSAAVEAEMRRIVPDIDEKRMESVRVAMEAAYRAGVREEAAVLITRWEELEARKQESESV